MIRGLRCRLDLYLAQVTTGIGLPAVIQDSSPACQYVEVGDESGEEPIMGVLVLSQGGAC